MLDKGKKVKLNVEKLKEFHQSVKFKNFVDKHKDVIFTANLYDDYKTMFTLLEDPTKPKWLFFEDDLIVVDEV